MEKVEYSDLYKFLCSIGVILIAISFLFPYLILKEPLGTLTTIDTYNKLTPSAQSIFNRRQELLTYTLKNIHIISLAIFTIGTTILSYGIIKWHGKQKSIDKIDDVKARKMIQEYATSMSTEEVAEKAIEEMNEEYPNTSSTVTTTTTTANEQNSFISKYLVVENSILNLINENVSDNFSLFPNYKIGRRVFDAILLEKMASRNLRGIGSPQKEYFLEIKYTLHLRKQYITNVIDYTYLLFTTFKAQSKRTAIPFIVIVVANNPHNSSFIKEVDIKAIKHEMIPTTSEEYIRLLKCIIIEEEQINSINFKNIIS